MGGGERHEQLALGETPNIAARVQGQAQLDEVLISTATYHLIEGLFGCEDRGQPLEVTQGFGSPEREKAYSRALELCRQIGETPKLFPALLGLAGAYLLRAELKTAQELAEQCLTLAQRVQDPVFLARAHAVLGCVLFHRGELAAARAHAEQSIARHDAREQSVAAVSKSVIPRIYAVMALSLLGYPDQALRRSQETLTLVEEITHPFSLGWVLAIVAVVHQCRREGQATQEWPEALITLATEQGFPYWLSSGHIHRGWALAEQGHAEEGIVELHQGMEASRAMGNETWWPYNLALLAESYGKGGQVEEGLAALAEALAVVDKRVGCERESELYRLKGELLLQAGVLEEAEGCFQQAAEIARRQSARSWELRAAMSLARLRQQQGKVAEARDLLAPVYNWFTEGFDTADLQDAKVLLEQLS